MRSQMSLKRKFRTALARFEEGPPRQVVKMALDYIDANEAFVQARSADDDERNQIAGVIYEKKHALLSALSDLSPPESEAQANFFDDPIPL